MSAVIRSIVADIDLDPLEKADRVRPHTLASELPLTLVDQVDEVAGLKGITRSELIAAALIAATSSSPVDHRSTTDAR